MGVFTTKTRFDDFTGEPGEDVETFSFVLDGIEYTMDACQATRNLVRNNLAPFTAIAQKRVLGPGPTGSEIREWARKNGIHVADSGRLPDHVIEAYHKAHP